MSTNVLLISPDDGWSHHMNTELKKRGFSFIQRYENNLKLKPPPDAILLDVTDYTEHIDSHVQNILTAYPLCEWILFFSGAARWADVSVLSRRAYDIVSKSANLDNVTIFILAACMRKKRAEERLKSLSISTGKSFKTLETFQ